MKNIKQLIINVLNEYTNAEIEGEVETHDFIELTPESEKWIENSKSFQEYIRLHQSRVHQNETQVHIFSGNIDKIMQYNKNVPFNNFVEIELEKYPSSNPLYVDKTTNFVFEKNQNQFNYLGIISSEKDNIENITREKLKEILFKQKSVKQFWDSIDIFQIENIIPVLCTMNLDNTNSSQTTN